MYDVGADEIVEAVADHLEFGPPVWPFEIDLATVLGVAAEWSYAALDWTNYLDDFGAPGGFGLPFALSPMRMAAHLARQARNLRLRRPGAN